MAKVTRVPASSDIRNRGAVGSLGLRSKSHAIALTVLLSALALLHGGCGAAHTGDSDKGDPPVAKVAPMSDLTLFSVENPEQFPLATASAHSTSSELVVTGSVMPDVSRNVPVVSLASGRVAAIHTRLGDSVVKGQLLFTVRSDDVTGGFSVYRMAVADEVLARAQLERAKDLLEHGAIATNDMQVAQDTEDKAKIAVDTAAEHLRLIGNDPTKPIGMVDAFAPVSGTVTDQQITVASAIQAFGTPSPFTISDLSRVWVICDVYENDLPGVHIGDTADLRLSAYPNRSFRGRVNNILPILDPNLRTAKVRIEVENPGVMRVGMFVKAVFQGQTKEMHTVVPASAVMHMHDRDYVFVPASGRKFRRVEVTGGDLLADDKTQQEIKSGLEPGQQVVSNAIILDRVVTQ